MGWAWFLPCYVQLTVILPLILAINRLPGKLAATIYGALMLIVLSTNGFLLMRNPTGIFLTFDNQYFMNYDFLNDFFMKPQFHLASYLWGAILCLLFLRYTRDIGNSIPKEDQASSTRFFTKIRESQLLRYALYLGVVAAKLLIVLSLHGYIADNNAWSTGLQATYATLAYPGFAIATSIIVISALLGRAEFVRFFLGGDFWTMWRSLAFGMSMYAPIN
jgi:hypothetical protein